MASEAQLPKSKIDVLNAKTFEFDQIDGMKVRKLIGEVRLKQDNTLLYCDSAYQFEATNYVEAYQNVHIHSNDSIHIYGDLLKYYGNTKRVRMERNVRMNDNTMFLTTNSIDYDLSTGNAYYTSGGRMVNSTSVLISKYGYYNTKTREFFFKKDVVLTSPEYTIKGDTLKQNTLTNITYFLGPTTINTGRETIYSENGYYNNIKDQAVFSENAKLQNAQNVLTADSIFFDRKINFGRAYRNITIVDKQNSVEIHGHYGELLQYKKQSFVTQKAYAKKILEKNDSMYLIADTIYSYQRDSFLRQKQYIKAYRNAQLLKIDIQSVCDSMVYQQDDSCITMYYMPVMWSGQNQITADTIQLFINNNKLDSFYLLTNAFLISRETALAFNQAKGKLMKGKFRDSKIEYIHVMSNAQSIYYPKEEKDSTYIGVNVIDCSEMEFYFDKNKIKKCNFITEPQATLYPIGELKPEELKLKGFKWQQGKKPTLKSVLKYFTKN